MAFEHLESPQKIIPSAADGVTITVVASWGTATWVELTPATTSAWLLSCFSLSPGAGVNANYNMEIEFGVGGAGSEIVVSTYRVTHKGSSSGGQGLPMVYHIPVLLDAIPQGVRVAVRGRKDTTVNRTFVIKVGYLEKPIVGHVTTTARPTTPIPFTANSAIITPNATAWVNSAWAVLTASATTDVILTDLIVQSPVDDVEAEIDLGVGASGSEAVITTVKIGSEQSQNTPSCIRLWPVFDKVTAGQRLTARLRKTGVSVVTWNVAVNSIAKPL